MIHKNHLFIAVLVGATAIVAIFLIFILPGIMQPSIGFYGIAPEIREAISLGINPDPKEKQHTFRTLVYSSAQPLSPQIKKGRRPDILILFQGENTDFPQQLAEKKKSGLTVDILTDMTSSVKASALHNEKGDAVGVPLLLDHYEVAIDRQILAKVGLLTINSWTDIEKFAEKAALSGVSTPILFAGQDDRQLIDITGAMVEALSSSAAWQTIVDEIVKAPSPKEYYGILTNLSEKENAPLYPAIQKIANWYTLGLLGHQSFSMSSKDVLNFMDSGICALVIMPLSMHRTVGQETISRYSAVFFPSEQPASSRHLTVPEIIAIPLSRSKFTRETLENLTSTAQQEVLTRASGLAPAHGNSNVSDRQADDVRYWVAATNAPLPALSDAAFLDDTQRKAFAEALRAIIVERADAIERNSRRF